MTVYHFFLLRCDTFTVLTTPFWRGASSHKFYEKLPAFGSTTEISIICDSFYSHFHFQDYILLFSAEIYNMEGKSSTQHG